MSQLETGRPPMSKTLTSVGAGHAAQEDFVLDEETHVYKLRGKRLIGVSDVIRDNGLTDDRFFTPGGRSRGRAVHLGLQLALAGKLRWDTLHPDLHGFVKSGLLLFDFLKCNIVELEVPRYHPTWLYAGTADAVIEHFGLACEVVIDFKTGDMPSTTKYQVWAYDLLQPTRKARLHWGVKLHRDGSAATITELDEDRYAGDKFLNLLSVTRMRQEHGVSKIPKE